MDLFDSIAADAQFRRVDGAPTPVHRAEADALLEGLNPEQKAAVIHQGGPLLIMAGAGSGKTRVLTHRIAYLLATGRAQAGEIMAITFTNKAAAEMRERVGALVGDAQGRRMLVATFHSACVRILRQNYDPAGLKSTFSIYDMQDAQRLLGMVLKAQDVDVKRYTPRSIGARISDLKNELITPNDYISTMGSDPVSQIVAAAYPEYNRRLRQANAVDFDDIIMLTVQMLSENPAIAEYYQRRYRHILVDEYQDTNHAQYVLVRHLVGIGASAVAPGELTVVGDSDQSIYAFRGATIRNIEEFEKDFPNAQTIVLEQNYRSTGNILSAANAVISRNSGRRPKKLWTASGSGDRIVLDALDSEYEEARNVIRHIEALDSEGADWGDIAVFYRTNAQSRSMEEMLMRSGIPYRLVGGTRFYERMEIKDALAYLQAVVNPEDTVAIRRILNTPRRGIGDKAEAAIMAHADRYGLSFGAALDAVTQGQTIDGLSPRAATSVAEFWTMLTEIRMQAESGASTAHVLDELISRSGYLTKLRESEDPQDASRVENLAELLSVAEEFDVEQRQSGETEGTLAAFLERVALVADADQVPGDDDRRGAVTLMTVHTAKGLEFPYVFVTGLEDGTFPHRRSMEDMSELAEERRLAYVAITRARKKLYLSRAATRSAWGQSEAMAASRFLDDIPEETVQIGREPTRETYGFSSGTSASSNSGMAFGSGKPGSLQSTFVKSQPTKRLGSPSVAGGKLGQASAKPALKLEPGDRVKHGKYGEGTVTGIDGSGPQAVARVDFGGTQKRLLIRMAPLKKL